MLAQTLRGDAGQAPAAVPLLRVAQQVEHRLGTGAPAFKRVRVDRHIGILVEDFRTLVTRVRDRECAGQERVDDLLRDVPVMQDAVAVLHGEDEAEVLVPADGPVVARALRVAVHAVGVVVAARRVLAVALAQRGARHGALCAQRAVQRGERCIPVRVGRTVVLLVRQHAPPLPAEVGVRARVQVHRGVAVPLGEVQAGKRDVHYRGAPLIHDVVPPLLIPPCAQNEHAVLRVDPRPDRTPGFLPGLSLGIHDDPNVDVVGRAGRNCLASEAQRTLLERSERRVAEVFQDGV
mmetsp:Transcript_112350/g.318260  ORF Transcript_112350/g.318260 Transcript_112350/m.318260 type:complete len:292 (-) Transcript_112350:121-996(-)